MPSRNLMFVCRRRILTLPPAGDAVRALVDEIPDVSICQLHATFDGNQYVSLSWLARLRFGPFGKMALLFVRRSALIHCDRCADLTLQNWPTSARVVHCCILHSDLRRLGDIYSVPGGRIFFRSRNYYFVILICTAFRYLWPRPPISCIPQLDPVFD